MESREEDVIDCRERTLREPEREARRACSHTAVEGFDPHPPEKLGLKTSPAESHSNLGFPAIR